MNGSAPDEPAVEQGSAASQSSADAGVAAVQDVVPCDAEGKPLPDIRTLPTRDYLSMILFRSVRCSVLLSPYVFGFFAVEQAAHSLVRLKARCVLLLRDGAE